MKAIVCEMCGSHDLVKQDGLYVCQHCGTKYTVDEVKKLMIDLSNISDENPIPVKVVGDTENFKKLARAVLDAGNGEEALKYANQILEVNADDFDGWVLKFHAYLGSQSLEESHYQEALAAFHKIEELAKTKEDSKKIVDACVDDFLVNIQANNKWSSNYYNETNQSIKDVFTSRVQATHDVRGSSDFTCALDKNLAVRDQIAEIGLSIAESLITEERLHDQNFRQQINLCIATYLEQLIVAHDRARSYGKPLSNEEGRHDHIARVKTKINEYEDKQMAANPDNALGNLTPAEYRDLQDKEGNLKALELQRKNGSYILWLGFGAIITIAFIFSSMLDFHFWGYEELSAFQVIMIVCGIAMVLRGLFELVDIMTKMKELREEIWQLEDKQNAKKQIYHYD